MVLHAHLPNLDVQLIARVCTSCLELEDSLCQLDASGSLPTRLIPEELETPFHDDVDCKSQRVHRLQEQLDEKGKGEFQILNEFAAELTSNTFSYFATSSLFWLLVAFWTAVSQLVKNDFSWSELTEIPPSRLTVRNP